MNEFSVWISKKYTEWRGDTIGRGGTVSAYARWVGVAQPLMDDWMKGRKVPTSAQSIGALVGRYGSEVYDVLGINNVPGVDAQCAPELRQIADLMHRVPHSRHRDMIYALKDWIDKQS